MAHSSNRFAAWMVCLGISFASAPAHSDSCADLRALTTSAQLDFVPHIVGEDARHTERIDGEAKYHVARSPMPDLMRCGVVNSGPAHSLNCTPAESNLIPSVARKRVKAAATRISQCVGEPVVGPLKSASEHRHLQWFVTDWHAYWPVRYRLDWSPELREPAWTFVAEPMTITNDYVGKATRIQKLRARGADGLFCRQVLAVTRAAQSDFRASIGKLSEKGEDFSLFRSSLPLIDFAVLVGVGGTLPNMLFAERVVSSTMTYTQAEEMGFFASHTLSACLQAHAERLSDREYAPGMLEMVWRLSDEYSARPVNVFAVVRFEPPTNTVTRTAIRFQRKE